MLILKLLFKLYLKKFMYFLQSSLNLITRSPSVLSSITASIYRKFERPKRFIHVQILVLNIKTKTVSVLSSFEKVMLVLLYNAKHPIYLQIRAHHTVIPQSLLERTHVPNLREPLVHNRDALKFCAIFGFYNMHIDTEMILLLVCTTFHTVSPPARCCKFLEAYAMIFSK